jgi:AraC family transcriptional regulator
MTYPFKFAGAPEPVLTYGAQREWDGFAVREARAGAGRHDGVVMAEHRIAFYLCEPTRTDCGTDGVRQSRLSIHGDFDFVPAGCDGFWEDSAAVDLISIRLAPQLMDEVAEGLGASGPVALTPRLSVRDPLVSHIAAALQAELEAPAPAARLCADGLAAALATRLLQDFAMAPIAGRQTLSKPKLRRLLDYVEANLEIDLGLAELAAVVGLSVPHLTALFRRTMGQSLHRYVVERRVTRARDRLLAGDAPIAQVALETGFAHQSHMARWMKRLLGATPAQVAAAGG